MLVIILTSILSGALGLFLEPGSEQLCFDLSQIRAALNNGVRDESKANEAHQQFQ